MDYKEGYDSMELHTKKKIETECILLLAIFQPTKNFKRL